eukprot:3249024-Pleurochrysis_carterae.AAC.1
MPRAPAVYNETYAASSVTQMPATSWRVTARTRGDERTTTRGNRRGDVGRMALTSTRGRCRSLTRGRCHEGSSYERNERVGHCECEVNRRVVQPLVHLDNDGHGPCDQLRSVSADQFSRAHGAIECRIEIEM